MVAEKYEVIDIYSDLFEIDDNNKMHRCQILIEKKTCYGIEYFKLILQ